MTSHSNSGSVIRAARQTLSYAVRGWQDYLDRGDRADAGLMTAITNARSVTFVLQNLKNLEPGFAKWWQEHVKVLNTPGARWATNARNMIEKQGVLPDARGVVHIHSISSAQVNEMLSRAPSGVTELFLGDTYGRSGWTVELEDGSTTSVYFSLPETIGHAWTSLETVEGRRLEDVFPEYLAVLRSLVDAADSKFNV